MGIGKTELGYILKEIQSLTIREEELASMQKAIASAIIYSPDDKADYIGAVNLMGNLMNKQCEKSSVLENYILKYM